MAVRVLVTTAFDEAQLDRLREVSPRLTVSITKSAMWIMPDFLSGVLLPWVRTWPWRSLATSTLDSPRRPRPNGSWFTRT